MKKSIGQRVKETTAIVLGAATMSGTAILSQGCTAMMPAGQRDALARGRTAITGENGKSKSAADMMKDAKARRAEAEQRQRMLQGR